MKEKELIWLAASIGFLGSMTANFIFEIAPKNTRLSVGLVSFIGFFLLLWALSKGYGKINIKEKSK